MAFFGAFSFRACELIKPADCGILFLFTRTDAAAREQPGRWGLYAPRPEKAFAIWESMRNEGKLDGEILTPFMERSA